MPLEVTPLFNSSRPMPRWAVWPILVGFVAASWALDRIFVQIVSRMSLDNSTRALYAHVSSGDWQPFAGNVVFHWIPKAIAITFLAVVTLSALGVSAQETLFRVPRTGRSLLLIGGALLTLGLYQWARWWLDPRWTPPRSVAGLGALAVYSVRFIPSAWVEEVTFRGVLFGALRGRYSALIAWPISLTLFAAAHVYGGAEMALHSLLVGIVLTGLYQATGSLWPCALLHAATNVLHALLRYGA